jgi:hypothetical protein
MGGGRGRRGNWGGGGWAAKKEVGGREGRTIYTLPVYDVKQEIITESAGI